MLDPATREAAASLIVDGRKLGAVKLVWEALGGRDRHGNRLVEAKAVVTEISEALVDEGRMFRFYPPVERIADLPEYFLVNREVARSYADAGLRVEPNPNEVA